MCNACRALESNVLRLFSRKEVEDTVRECGFWQRVPQRVRPFEFVLHCALASVLEGKRGFASVWRLLATAVNIVVAHSPTSCRNLARKVGKRQHELIGDRAPDRR